ncbi:MAG: type IV pilus assembly protein PilM [Dethiobacter sp.]|nr:type IV pilus assembly protein PilM [Dethiobacter sp.]MBS3901985.1 type IV pilus assembly protein PilM [Dethiobacter sp.]
MFAGGGSIGLELDTGFIRAAEVRGKSGKLKVTAAAEVLIPKTAVVDGVVQEVATVSEAIDKLWSQAKFSNRNVVLGMFNQSVIIRLINFPKVPKNKLEQAVKLQAGEYIPIPPAQMLLDLALVGDVDGEEGPQYELLLVAARKAQLEPSLAALKMSKLVPKVIDLSPLAMMRVVPQEKLAGNVVLVDLSMGLGSVLLAVDGMPRFARVMPVGLAQFHSSLGHVLAAEQYHRQVAATLERGSEGQGFGRWGQSVAAEIRTSISYYIKQENLKSVSRILLSGIGARAAGLAALLQDELEVAVEAVKPLANLNGCQTKAEVSGAEFAVSMGLALRGMEQSK